MNRTALNRVMRFLRWRVWPWRVEALVAFGLWHAWGVLAGYLGRGLALAALSLLALSAEVRGWLRQLLRRTRLLRRWVYAARHAGLTTEESRLPQVVAVEHVGGYQCLRVRVARGGRVADLERAAEALAAMLGVGRVEVIRQLHNARFADVLLLPGEHATVTNLRRPNSAASSPPTRRLRPPASTAQPARLNPRAILPDLVRRKERAKNNETTHRE